MLPAAWALAGPAAGGAGRFAAGAVEAAADAAGAADAAADAAGAVEGAALGAGAWVAGGAVAVAAAPQAARSAPRENVPTPRTVARRRSCRRESRPVLRIGRE